jgi:hypothetical protein
MGKSYITFFSRNPDYFVFLFGKQNINAHLKMNKEYKSDYPPFLLLRRMYLKHLEENGLEKTVDEQEIDISEEAMMFGPVRIEKDGKEKSLVASVASELSRMTGAIEMDQLVPMLNELAEKGKDSPLGGLVNDWNEYEQAA